MALCSTSQAKGVPVQTQSGQDVGRVSGFILDTERGCIVQIEVRPAGWVRGLVNDTLLIHWSDVLSWTESLITVKDTAIQVGLGVPSAVPSV